MALRYLFSRKSHGAVNIISAISVAGVAVATAAMIIVLSVFNGFTQLSISKLSRFDAPLVVVPDSGKVFSGADELAGRLSALSEIALASPQITEQAFAIAEGRQMPVMLKGIEPASVAVSGLEGAVIDGTATVDSLAPGLGGGVFSVGTAIGLGVRPGSGWPVAVYEPRRLGRYNPANPAASFRTDTVACMGVFQAEQEEYDRDMIIVPLAMTRRLLDYNDSEASVIALYPAEGVSDQAARSAAGKLLKGTSLRVLDRMEQQPDIFRMISVEKWITFAMLAFILVIASFNIVSTLSMMVLEKTPNMAVLGAMGGTPRFISAIFANQGWLVTLAGGAAGLLAGSLLVLGQERWGWIKLAASDPSLLSVEAYPVALTGSDILTVLLLLGAAAFVMALVGAMLPRRNYT